MGKYMDYPKTVAKATTAKEPVTIEKLAEVEENILKQLEALENALIKKVEEKTKNN